MIICFTLFCGYLYYQWWLVNTGRDQLLEDTIEEIRRNKILNGEITLAGYVNTYTYTVYTYITYIYYFSLNVMHSSILIRQHVLKVNFQVHIIVILLVNVCRT
jgi:hypothetical protein